MTAWFLKLGSTGKSIAVLFTAVLFGLTLAVSLGGWFGLPAQVESNTFSIMANTDSISGIGKKMDRMICLQLLPDEVNPLSCP